MKKILISSFLLLSSVTIWGQGAGGYGSGVGYPSNSLIAQGVVTYYRNTSQGGNAPKWYDINATGTAYISRDSISVTSGVVPISAILPFGTATVGTTGLVQAVTKDGIVPAFTSTTGYEVSRFELFVESLSGTRKFLYYGVDYTVSVGTNTVTFTGITNFVAGEKVFFRFR